MVAMTNSFLAYSIKQAFAKSLIDFWEDLHALRYSISGAF